MLTITHTHEAGTIIEGTERGDGTAQILKANGWRWGRSISAWYVPHSRDRLPKDYVITRTASSLETAGYTLALEIDRTTRSTGEVEAGKAIRQANRADALEAKALRKSADAQQAWNRADAAGNALPEGGEPIKIGHHSEQRHRSAIEKAHRRMGQAIAADAKAEETARRARVAAATTSARYKPVTVANRIEKITADIRRVERSISADVYDRETGYKPATAEQQAKRAEHYAPQLNELRDQLAYWQQIRADQIATGQATNYSRETVKKGDAVKIRGTWSRVQRANPKTVRIQVEAGWDLAYAWAEVQDHRPAAE